MQRILAEIAWATTFLAIMVPAYLFGDWLAHVIVP